MTAASDEHDPARNGSKGVSDRQKRREERLALELRANLKRRKAQARARDGDANAAPAVSGDASRSDGHDDST